MRLKYSTASHVFTKINFQIINLQLVTLPIANIIDLWEV